MLTTVKTANPSIHMRLRPEHPRERLRTNSLGKRPMHDFRCWSEKKKVGFNCLYLKLTSRIFARSRTPNLGAYYMGLVFWLSKEPTQYFTCPPK